MQGEEGRIPTVWLHWHTNPATGIVTRNVTGEGLFQWQLSVVQTNSYITMVKKSIKIAD